MAAGPDDNQVDGETSEQDGSKQQDGHDGSDRLAQTGPRKAGDLRPRLRPSDRLGKNGVTDLPSPAMT